VTDWTTVFTTLSAASVAGIVGYASARLQSKTELAKVRAENDRLEMQHREAHFQHRQGTYHDLLFEASRWTYWRSVGAKRAEAPEEGAAHEKTTKEFNEWFDRVRFAISGVILYGTDDVMKEAFTLDKAYQGVERALSEAVRRTAEKRGGKDFDLLWLFGTLSSASWEAQYRRLVDAMRKDVAP
jgi:hypothetical protein